MNKNAYIISGALVIAFIVFGFLFFGNQKTSVAPTSISAPVTNEGTVNIGVREGTESAMKDKALKKVVAEVKYTDSGFSPKSVTVNVGDAIVWINESNKKMWVASAVHPTHEVYPEFDQLKSVENGDTYEFTFTKKGQWKYHNHMMPSDTGIVVVK